MDVALASIARRLTDVTRTAASHDDSPRLEFQPAQEQIRSGLIGLKLEHCHWVASVAIPRHLDALLAGRICDEIEQRLRAQWHRTGAETDQLERHDIGLLRY